MIVNGEEYFDITIPGTEGYLVSKAGQIFSTKRNKNLKWCPGKGNYYRVTLMTHGKQKCYSVHRIVALTFLGPRPAGKMVCHKDGNRSNNSLGNLYYGNAQENSNDAISHGTLAHGVNHHKAKLTDDQVISIRLEFSTKKFSMNALAKKYDVSRQQIKNIITRYSWKHI